MRNSTVWRIVSCLVCPFLAVPQIAQSAPDESPTQLNIVIVEGEGAVNNLRQRVVREPIVRVEDQNHKPVAGAVVVFLLPGNGPSGTFANGSNLLTEVTGPDGQAAARGLTANKLSGPYKMQVTASKGNLSANAIISVTNGASTAGGAGVSTKVIVILAIAAAVAAGAAVALTRGGSSMSSTGTTGSTATSLSPGTPTVGAPH